ncbi:MAG: hypothetical protein ACI89Z_001511, partial [Porticoccus sp.]
FVRTLECNITIGQYDDFEKSSGHSEFQLKI